VKLSRPFKDGYFVFTTVMACRLRFVQAAFLENMVFTVIDHTHGILISAGFLTPI
jgi:hypothetical protein